MRPIPHDHRLLPADRLPEGFSYSDQFILALEDNLTDLVPWYFLAGAQLLERYKGLNQRYPGKGIVPFAQRQDNDDVACWCLNEAGVTVIHDFASSGWEVRGRFKDFHTWLRQAVEDYIEFHHVPGA